MKTLALVGALFVLGSCAPQGKVEFPPYVCVPTQAQGRSILFCQPVEVDEGTRT
jgi:hypothetical protein